MSLQELFEEIPGQGRLAGELQAHLTSPRNSYFFIGPHDAGVLSAAKAFAKALLCENGACGECRSCRAIAQDLHPDVAVFERSGASLSVDDAHEIVNLAARSTSGSTYRIIIVPELELVGRAAPVLLKSVEEPPRSTIFLLLASMEVPELITLMSRSIVVRFDQLSDEQIYKHLIGLGFQKEDATFAVKLSAGRWSRAVDLAGDAELRESFSLWEEVPSLLRSDMSQIVSLVDRLIAAGAMMESRKKVEQKREVEALDETAKSVGVSRSSLSAKVEERHKRELRKVRTGELRTGLLLLERQYRDVLVAGDLESSRSASSISAIRQIEDAQTALTRNCNEFLMLTALLSRLADKAS